MGKKEIFESIIAVGVIIGMVFGAMSYFATAKELNLVDMRLDQKIVDDSIRATQRQIWQLEDRYPGQPDCSVWQNKKDSSRYRILKDQLKGMEKKRDAIIQKSKGKL
jgi:hypothetical protein